MNDSFNLVIKVNVFLQDMNDFSAMNEVYTEGIFYFSQKSNNVFLCEF